ncbi:L-threonylcarbamoyladenylate synthase [Prochlorococcus sp. MIT 1223]|uniref:L-threonylcarbamoyladenylate synthase n=1 Tax=Prochlorococcus sp. MIT 1223 TaxID=3096217 RepID=UPI002A74A5FD|nr:L-threonylcarbamoyladenylate synthase [Prochlorococcus sp. MIT 1223]
MHIVECQAKELSKRLDKGEIALFPTDTLPAIAVCPKYASKLWEIKKRPFNKPLILMSSKKEDLLKIICSSAKEDALKMSEAFWPGALTMVLPATGEEVPWLNQNSNTVGLRVPSNDQAIKLLDESGPLATSSANLSGEEPVLTAEEAAKTFPGVPLLGPTPWPNPSGLASSVIKWESPGRWRLLRRGAVMPLGIND